MNSFCFSPTFPQVRALDAFNPEDSAIPLALAGGVTTVQVLPGSGNLMGGEATSFKLRIDKKTVEHMVNLRLLIQLLHYWNLIHFYNFYKLISLQHIKDSPPALKMACGENPKRVYGNRGETPMSRMGSAWLMREKFFQAQQMMLKQDAW